MADEPAFELLYEVSVDLEPPQQIGDTGRGTRIIFPLKGGRFEGPRLRGRVVPGGADWLLLRADGTGELDVRGMLETDDGALLYVTYRGYVTRVPELVSRWQGGEAVPREEHYFVVTPYYETAAPQYAWLTQTACVGLGSLVRGGVSYRVFAVK